MDLIKHDVQLFVEHLENDGVIMICGSLQMQRDVEKVLEEMTLSQKGKALLYYKEKKQILTDCY
ncbi:hypothetical protein [Sphingobacterium sp. IITKGP-BTPF85]|nr:hypothetical protein [Sphingobacterium sp. IITKGP-BTPF85]KKX48448.1 hypothetical protein L950_0221120 [Sphingobacterium sp. IITKGP-BTPF85]